MCLRGKLAAGEAHEAAPAPLLVDMAAVEPVGLQVQGESALPFARPGDVVVYDRGRPNETRDLDVVVTVVPGEPLPLLKVRKDCVPAGRTVRTHRVYDSLNERVRATCPPWFVPEGEALDYPVVAVLRSWREIPAQTGGPGER